MTSNAALEGIGDSFRRALCWHSLKRSINISNDSRTHQADSLTLSQCDHVERRIARVACADRIFGEHSKRVDGERLEIFDLERCSIIWCDEHATRIPFLALSDSVVGQVFGPSAFTASSEFANFKVSPFAVLINCFHLILI